MSHNDKFIEGKFVLSIPSDKYPYFRTGMVVLRCAVCHRTVEALAVAKEGGLGVGYINPETPVQ